MVCADATCCVGQIPSKFPPSARSFLVFSDDGFFKEDPNLEKMDIGAHCGYHRQ